MKWNTGALLILAVCGMSGVALAGSDSGLYIGGSLGTAYVDYSDNHNSDFANMDVDISGSDTAYKVFGGYNFGLVPFLNIAVEAAYVDFGKQEDEIHNIKGNTVEIHAYTVEGLLGFDLGPVGLFVKAGAANWDGDIKTFAGNDSQSGTDPVYGVGAKMQFGSFAVRAEYEYYDLDKAKIDYGSIGVAYTF